MDCLFCGEIILDRDFTELECVNTLKRKSQRIGKIGYMHNKCKTELRPNE